MPSITTKPWIFLLLIGAMFAVTLAAGIFILRPPMAAPSISGTLVQQTQPLEDFTLIDHHQRPFTNEDLLGRWHFIVYGYTYCPDVCPMTLSIVARMMERLHQNGYAEDTGLLFYSVDPRRDTPEHLAEYVPYFHGDFLGLTYDAEAGQSHLAFEKGLGIFYQIPVSDPQGNRYDENNYPVDHGTMIYLLNPQGELQAVLTPEFNDEGIAGFSADQLYRDYELVRTYLDAI